MSLRNLIKLKVPVPLPLPVPVPGQKVSPICLKNSNVIFGTLDMNAPKNYSPTRVPSKVTALQKYQKSRF